MTDDIERTAEAAAANGGQVISSRWTVAQNGRMAIVGDPVRRPIGVWQPGTQNGFEVRDEVGTATGSSCYTRRLRREVAFYRDVFEWDTHTIE